MYVTTFQKRLSLILIHDGTLKQEIRGKTIRKTEKIRLEADNNS
jgi:hypothetical protein